MSVRQWYFGVLSRPLELIIGLSILATAAAGGAIQHVANISLSVLFLASLVYIRSLPDAWRQLTSNERLILLGFVMYVISAFLSFYNVSDEREYIKHLGKYARFLMIVPVYLLFSRSNLRLFPYLLAGAIIAGPVYLCATFLSIAENPEHNAEGAYHHITFGDTAMLAALLLITQLVATKIGRVKIMVIGISIICLLYASIMSQARGAWLALLIYVLLLLPIAVRQGKIKIRSIIIVFILFGSVLSLSPAKDIITSRIQLAVNELELFQSGENHASSVGSRLAMWHIAVNTWVKHPLIGTGLGDFDLEIRDSVEQGLYKPIFEHSSTHNIFFQALATTGTIGFVTMCFALFILPFRLLYKREVGEENVAGLSGMVVLIAFVVFGLTESWILRAPVVSVYLIYIVTLISTSSREEIG